MSQGNAAAVGCLVVLGIAAVVGMPLAVIWALNTLFSLGLEFTFWNWLATFVLMGAARGNVTVNKSD